MGGGGRTGAAAVIRELGQAGADRLEVEAEVCIVGGGTAGLFLAQRLHRAGRRVVVLEAGGRSAARPDDLDQHCEHRRVRYRGADLGRSFGLGGTSVLWGGQMIPLTPGDMQPRAAVGGLGWPIAHDELARFIPEVAADLRLADQGGPPPTAWTYRRYPLLSALAAEGSDFTLRLSQWLPFGVRNFGAHFAETLARADGPEVWLDAAVTAVVPAADNPGRIAAVRARSRSGRQLSVRPQRLVVCAGALESTRLLLEIDETLGGALTRAGSPIGRYFCDHLSITCGRLEARDASRYLRETAPSFQGPIMRTPRLELSDTAQRELALASAFAHFTFRTRGDSGFDVVRQLLRRRQGSGTAGALSPALLARAAGDVAALGYWRTVHRRLWMPRDAERLLQVDIEQAPDPANRLSLGEARDAQGRRRLVIDWQASAADIRTVRRVAEAMHVRWTHSPLREVADLRLAIPEDFGVLDTLYDVYHPTGTLRMGARAADSVVDRDLKVWGLDNCHVCSTAVFPTGGSANPGLMHLALTARLARHLAERTSP